MTIYNTIKNTALTGLAALVIGVTGGCAKDKAAREYSPESETIATEEVVQIEVPEAPAINMSNAYFGPRVGGIWAHGESKADGTDYSKGNLTTGFEAEFTGRSGLGARITFDSFKSEASDTIGGTYINVKNDTLVVGADLIYTANSTSPVVPYAGFGVCNLSENSEATTGSPYNEHETFSSSITGYRGIAGVKMRSGKWSAHLEAGLTSYPGSENVKTTSSLTAGIGLDF
jgi:hypothetical protein